jgi:hypothetical protein
VLDSCCHGCVWPVRCAAMSSSRLTYPRLASCDIGFYSGPAVSSSVLPTMPSLSAASAASDPSGLFHVESNALRTIDQVRTGWVEEESSRRARAEARLHAEQVRLQLEADLASAAALERERAELARLAAEAARQAAEDRAREEARFARLKAEEDARLARIKSQEEEARDAAEAEKLRAEEALLAARKQELERKQQERMQQSAAAAAAYAPLVAHPVHVHHAPALHAPAPAAAAVASSSSSPTASQLAFERSFAELTGIVNSSQIRTLLQALNYDLDRAIAIFFAEDPPSMITALEKARSIQLNAQQQQQQQQHQAQLAPQHHAPAAHQHQYQPQSAYGAQPYQPPPVQMTKIQVRARSGARCPSVLIQSCAA